METRRNAIGAGLVISAALLVAGCGGDGLSISLTQDQLQNVVDSAFPLEGEREAVGVHLTEPVVTLVEGSDRIAFGLAISVTVVLEPGEGRIAQGVDERVGEREAEAQQATEEGRRGARLKAGARARAGNAAAGRLDRAGDRLDERTEGRDPEVLSGTVTVSSAVRYEASTGELFLADFGVDKLVVEQLPGRFNEPVTNLASSLIANRLNQVPIYQISDENLGGSIARALLDEVVVREGELVITVGLGS